MCCILSKFYIKPQQCPPPMEVSAVVSYRNSTSNHNLRASGSWSPALYLIEILHQTTTERRNETVFARCILSKFYIKPQRFSTFDSQCLGCILSKFYIKPQRHRVFRQYDYVVSYRNSTSNHNSGDGFPVMPLVVSYRNSTSNHNRTMKCLDSFRVVSYRNSTSNHN